MAISPKTPAKPKAAAKPAARKTAAKPAAPKAGKPERLIVCEPGEYRLGQARFKPAAGRSVADDQGAVDHAAPTQFIDRIGKDVEALFHHQPAVEPDHDLVVADPE